MDLALMKSMDYCLQQSSDNIKVIENFKYLLQSLCSAIATVKNKVAEPEGVDTHNDSGSNTHSAPIPAGTGFALKESGKVQASTGAGKTGIEQSEYGDIFPDAHSGMGASLNNFHFEDFFGDDPNALNMQFWPMEFAGNSLNMSE
jgi:hypothetical protein